MSSRADKSYQLGKFQNNEEELSRLKNQASIILDLEFEHLSGAGLKKGMRVMDMGCGPGIISSEIIYRSNPTYFIAADCNETSLNEARAHFNSKGLDHRQIRKSNIYDKNMDLNLSFDFIYSRLLFQHLSNPLMALENVKNWLAPEGRFCICDVDDRWINISPDSDAFQTLKARSSTSQRKRGGDRQVGIKLPEYFSRAGFEDIQTSCLLLSTQILGKEKFSEIVLGYMVSASQEEDASAARNELLSIREQLFSDHGWGAIAVFFVSGKNPN